MITKCDIDKMSTFLRDKEKRLDYLESVQEELVKLLNVGDLSEEEFKEMYVYIGNKKETIL